MAEHCILPSRQRMVLLSMSVLVCVGCGKSVARVQVYSVSGKVLVNGKPAERVEIKLWPLTPFQEKSLKTILPTGFSAADGSFQITTYSPGDGAPAGEYTLLATWPAVTKEGGEETFGADRLQGAYSDPQHAVQKVTVQAGENKLPPVELKTR
jgi:hypothetical protein